MLKVLQRHNSQRSINEPSTFSRKKRPESMRIPNSASFMPPSFTKNTNTKYTSCQNLNERCDDVIYEDENTENRLKGKFIKRYNSLTTLLMSSFRKAKSRKKLNQVQYNDNPGEFRDSNAVIEEEEPENIQKKNTTAQKNKLSRIPVSSTRPRATPPSRQNGPPRSPVESSNGVEEQEEEEELDESVPVCLGVKMISDDFIDQPLPTKSPSNSLYNSIKQSSEKNSHQTKIQTLRKNDKVSNKQAELYQTYSKLKEITQSKPLSKAFNYPASDMTVSNPYLNNDIASVSQTSRNKRHTLNVNKATPKSISDIYSSVVSVNNDYHYLSTEKIMPKNTRNLSDSVNNVVSSNNSIYSSIVSVGRYHSLVQSKVNTDTVESKDQIKRFMKHSKKQAPRPPPVSETSILKSEMSETESCKSECLPKQIYRQDPSEHIRKPVAKVTRSKTFTEQMQDMLNKAKIQKQSKPIEPEEKINKLIQSIGDYKDYEKYKVVEKNKEKSNDSGFIGVSTSKSTAKLVQSTSLIDEPQETVKEDEVDDIKDLVSVLAKQNDKFKKRFFECLMTKLWDTHLPIKEYLQLNKLMSALFGETYHKLGPNLETYSTSDERCSKIDYLNFSTTKNSKADAEHIVNLMRAYLDAKNPIKQAEYIQTKHLQKNEDFDFVTISSLLESLRVRQRVDEETESKMYKSIRNLNSMKLQTSLESEKFDLFENSEFSFKNGFNGLKKPDSEGKSSLLLKLSNESEKSNNDIYDECINVYLESLANKKNSVSSNSTPVKNENDLNSQFALSDSSKKSSAVYTSKSNDLNESKSTKNMTVQRPVRVFKEETPKIKSTSLKFPPEINQFSSSSSGAIVSFQPYQCNLVTSKETQKSDPKNVESLNKWTSSLLKSIYSVGDSDRTYKEHSSQSYTVRPGMHANQREIQRSSVARSSTKVRNLMDIFKNLNETSSLVPNKPVLIEKKPVYRKFDKQFLSMIEQDERKNIKGRDAGYLHSSEINPKNNSLRARLEQWNNLNGRQEQKDRSNLINDSPKKCKNHQKISDLIAEKIYQFERKEMQQAFY